MFVIVSHTLMHANNKINEQIVRISYKTHYCDTYISFIESYILITIA